MSEIADEQIVKNATVAVEEIRRHVDHQVESATAVDTKGAALLTLMAAVAGIVATHVHLDNGWRVLVGSATFVIMLAILGCCIQAIRPRGGFSYGANPKDLVALIDIYPHEQVMLALADSLRDARDRNVDHLAAKLSWFQNALNLAVAGVIAIAVMVGVEAIR